MKIPFWESSQQRTIDDEVQQYDSAGIGGIFFLCVFVCAYDLFVLIDDRPGSDANFRLLNVFWGTFQDSNISEKEFYAEFYEQLEPPLEKINHPTTSLIYMRVLPFLKVVCRLFLKWSCEIKLYKIKSSCLSQVFLAQKSSLKQHCDFRG